MVLGTLADVVGGEKSSITSEGHDGCGQREVFVFVEGLLFFMEASEHLASGCRIRKYYGF